MSRMKRVAVRGTWKEVGDEYARMSSVLLQRITMVLCPILWIWQGVFPEQSGHPGR